MHWSILLFISSVAASTCTYTPPANLTSTLYTVQSSDTIFTIATQFNRSVCDIARYNHMSDPELTYAGEDLYIPPQSCSSADDTSCLLTPMNATRDCVYGGPHTYYTFSGDTIEKIALNKFNITVQSLYSLSNAMANVTSATEEIVAGTWIKLPQCSPSRCGFEPYYYTVGTYRDLASQYGTTPGQIFAMNPTFNHSESAPGVGGWISLPMDCGLLSSNVTEVS